MDLEMDLEHGAQTEADAGMASAGDMKAVSQPFTFCNKLAELDICLSPDQKEKLEKVIDSIMKELNFPKVYLLMKGKALESTIPYEVTKLVSTYMEDCPSNHNFYLQKIIQILNNQVINFKNLFHFSHYVRINQIREINRGDEESEVIKLSAYIIIFLIRSKFNDSNINTPHFPPVQGGSIDQRAAAHAKKFKVAGIIEDYMIYNELKGLNIMRALWSQLILEPGIQPIIQEWCRKNQGIIDPLIIIAIENSHKMDLKDPSTSAPPDIIWVESWEKNADIKLPGRPRTRPSDLSDIQLTYNLKILKTVLDYNAFINFFDYLSNHDIDQDEHARLCPNLYDTLTLSIFEDFFGLNEVKELKKL